MSPEQARGESHRLDSRSDLYSLGVVHYQMLTGRLPFVASSRQEYIDQLLHRPPRPLRTIDDTIDPDLERICLKCLAKNVDERFTTCADLAKSLSEWRDHSNSTSQQILPLPTESAPPPSMRRIDLRLVAAAILIAVGIPAGIYLYASNSTAPTPGPMNNLAVAIPEQTPDPVEDAQTIDGWRNLMVEPPTFFAKALGSIPDKPRFDSLQKTFSVRSENCRWIATAGELKADEFELRADISVKDWIGAGGVLWQLAVDTRFAPKKAYRCLGVEYRRLYKDDPAELRIVEFVIKEYGFDNRHIEHTGDISLQAIETPTEEWMTLRCRVSPERVIVRFGESVEWVASDGIRRGGWIPALISTCGITGSGSETKVRGLSVHVVR